MSDAKQALDHHLRRGDVDGALAAAAQWASAGSSTPKETAIDIAKAVGTIYRDLVADPVHQFIQRAPQALPADIATIVVKAVTRLIDMTVDWERKVRSVSEERLARELRDHVRTKNWLAAVACVTELCRPAAGDAENLARRAAYIGNVLGTCINHPREADHVIRLLAKDPGQYHLTGALIATVQSEKESRHGQMMAANLDNIENQWATVLKSVQVDILNAMPAKAKMGEPEEEDLRNVGDMFRSILRVPIWRQEPDLLIDATSILVDFTPRELAASAKMSGIEARSYKELGFRARKAVAMVFMEIGGNASFANFYLQWAGPHLASAYGANIVELMGAFRNEAFAPTLLQLWDSKPHRDLRPEVATALGNLASPEAADILLQELAEAVSTKSKGIGDVVKRLNEFKVSQNALDPAQVRRAEQLLVALGRIVKSPRTSDAIRRKVISAVVETIPKDQARLAVASVLEVLTAKPQALTPEERKWAVEKLVDSLWIQDQSTKMHAGAERQDNILGDRAAATEALKRLAKTDAEHIINHIDRYCARYSGAYMAVAEVFIEMKDARAIPVLERMTMNALMFNPNQMSSYQKETYWDATEQKRKDLDKDQIVAPLIYAIGTIGGPDAIRILKSMQLQIASGRMASPGNESVQFLIKFAGMPGAGPSTIAAAAGESRVAPTRAPESMLESKLATSKLAESKVADSKLEDEEPAVPRDPITSSRAGKAEEADPAEVKALVKAITGSYFLVSAAKRAQAKIQALVRLGQILPIDAIEAVFENLGDKDPMVSSAAISTLSEYAAPGKPGYQIEMVMEKALEGLSNKDANVKAAAAKLLKEVGPGRPEIRTRIINFAKVADSSELKHKLKMILEQAGALQSAVAPVVSSGSSAPAADESPTWDTGKMGATDSMRKLELKKQYMDARRRWIAGGKKGDPPAAPPGLEG